LLRRLVGRRDGRSYAGRARQRDWSPLKNDPPHNGNDQEVSSHGEAGVAPHRSGRKNHTHETGYDGYGAQRYRVLRTSSRTAGV